MTADQKANSNREIPGRASLDVVVLQRGFTLAGSGSFGKPGVVSQNQ